MCVHMCAWRVLKPIPHRYEGKTAINNVMWNEEFGITLSSNDHMGKVKTTHISKNLKFLCSIEECIIESQSKFY